MFRNAIGRKCPGHLARKVILHHDNARPHSARATQDRIQELQWELLEHPPYSPDLASSDFHLFGPLKDHLVGKCFADDEVTEKTVKRLLCCVFRRTGKAMGRVYQCWWRIFREINVFPRFEYHMFYVLYLFVTYLLTLHRMNRPMYKTLHNTQAYFQLPFVFFFVFIKKANECGAHD
jgi:hypothetical protein